jgi:glycosyltransferase involved in cell wall biosynthesis
MAIVAVDGLAARAGGGAIYLRNQVSALAELRPAWDLQVFCVEENLEDVQIDATNVSFQSVSFASHSLVKRVLWQLSRFEDNLTDADLLYCPGGLAIPGISKPQVVTFQNPNPFAPLTLQPTVKLKLKRLIQRFWSLWSIHQADSVVFISEGCKEDVEDFTNLETVDHYVIYSGVAPYFEEELHSKRYDADCFPSHYVLSVSNFYRHKNYEALFRAFKHLEDVSDLYLVVAGNASDEAYYKEMKHLLESLSLEERVVLLGFVDHSRLRRLYAGAACYISTSVLETFGLTPLEAMSLGVPVAISNETVFPEICGDAAIYFDPYDPVDIASQIRRLLEDERLTEQLIEKGRTRTKKFSWERNARELAAVFEEVLNR